MKEEGERRREGKEGKRKREGGRSSTIVTVFLCLPVSLYIILAMPNEDSM